MDQLRETAFTYSPPRTTPPAGELSFEEFLAWCNEDTRAEWVDGKVVGYAGMWLILDEAHITNVAVHPGYRRNKIGRSLMLEIIRRAALMGINRMTLEVRPSNAPARRLYTALGFEERGLRKRYYTDTNEDAIIMWRENLAGGRRRPSTGCIV